MCDDYGDEEEMGDEEITVTGPVCPPNLFDYFMAFLCIPIGLVQGTEQCLQRLFGLAMLKRDTVDHERERKQAARDFEKALGKF